jgi:hypothetical protein
MPDIGVLRNGIVGAKPQDKNNEENGYFSQISL